TRVSGRPLPCGEATARSGPTAGGVDGGGTWVARGGAAPCGLGSAAVGGGDQSPAVEPGPGHLPSGSHGRLSVGEAGLLPEDNDPADRRRGAVGAARLPGHRRPSVARPRGTRRG